MVELRGTDSRHRVASRRARRDAVRGPRSRWGGLVVRGDGGRLPPARRHDTRARQPGPWRQLPAGRPREALVGLRPGGAQRAGDTYLLRGTLRRKSHRQAGETRQVVQRIATDPAAQNGGLEGGFGPASGREAERDCLRTVEDLRQSFRPHGSCRGTGSDRPEEQEGARPRFPVSGLRGTGMGRPEDRGPGGAPRMEKPRSTRLAWRLPVQDPGPGEAGRGHRDRDRYFQSHRSRRILQAAGRPV